MNTLTQQQINQYQWHAADGVAVPTNPYVSKAKQPFLYPEFEAEKKSRSLQTNAPDGIYSGEAFELIDQYETLSGDWTILDRSVHKVTILNGRVYQGETDWAYRPFLHLKPSHLPAVLTTQPGDEWKDRYKEVWYVQERGSVNWTKVTRPDICDNYRFERYAALRFDKQDQATKREWRLITPPAEQESETPLDILKRTNYIVPADEANCVAETVLHDEVGMVTHAMEEYAKVVTKQLQSTLTQKDKRIAELEREREWVSVYTRLPNLIDGEDYSENVFAVVDGRLEIMCLVITDSENGSRYCWANCYGKIDGEAEYDDEYNVTHWKPIDRTLPTPPQH